MKFVIHEFNLHKDDLFHDLRKKGYEFLGDAYDKLRAFCKDKLKLDDPHVAKEAFGEPADIDKIVSW